MGGQKIANNPLGSFTATDDKTADYRSRQAVGIDFGSVSGDELTERRVSASDPLPVTPVGTALQMKSYTPSRTSIASGASTEAIAENTSRKPGSYMQNNTTSDMYGNYGSNAAVASEGFKINRNGGVFFFDTTQAINLTQSSGSALYIDIFEVT